MIDFEEKEHYTIADLVRIMEILRQPEGGCPWDQKQTHQSIRHNFIEETYEAVEAIDLEDSTLLCEELGDVLLQVVFHSQLEAEKGVFDFDAVCDGICKKLVYRHPHVFGNEKAETPGGALASWEKMKNAEKGRNTAADRLDSVPVSLPALMRSAKAQKRAAEYGFVYEDGQQAVAALKDRVDALAKAEPKDADRALGQILFHAVAAARMMKVEPEEALNHATIEFCEQVKACEKAAGQDGLLLEQLTPEQRNTYWEKQTRE